MTPKVFLSLAVPLFLGWNAPVFAEDNDWRIAPELILKNQWLSETNPSPGSWISLGLDGYKSFSINGKKFATASFQIYEWCVNDRARRPSVLEDKDDCQLVTKTSVVNFHVSGDGKFNILVGHPELPFGLGVPVSSSETLRSMLTPRDIGGLKVDWGIGVNGTVDGWSYAATLTRGSGFEWENEGRDGKSPWAFAARIGTATDSQRYLPVEGYGLSYFSSEGLTPNGAVVDRWRVAGDWVDYLGPWGVMAQLSVGETGSKPTRNYFLELNRSDQLERLVGYLQLKSFNEERMTGWEKASSVHFGARYQLTKVAILSAEISREFDVFGAAPEQTIIDFQLKLRWE